MDAFPTPHLEKLRATLANVKLPESDKGKLEEAIVRYNQWITDVLSVDARDTSQTVPQMVALLNEYRNYLDIDVIFDSDEDFLYRQKGQTKLDNSVIEEFLPHLISKCVFAQIEDQTIQLGPKKAFSAIYFTSSLDNALPGAGLHVRTKDQDFAIARRVFLKTSYTPNFEQSETNDFYVAYVAAECKTNLDKTMFQEACATAHDVKSAVAGAKYFLLCEWLDMTPQSTAATDIDEVLILRRAKRMSSNIRGAFGNAEGRRRGKQRYVEFLEAHEFQPAVFQRFVAHVAGMLTTEEPAEADVLSNGYF